MKHFLIYIDSLGYEKRAEEEAKTIGRPVEDIRESYIGSIEGRLKELEKRGVINSYKKSGYGDDFVVFTGSIWNAFKTIGGVLKANLPIEIGIGFLKVDELYLIERSKGTISNLKTNIISKYKKFYEKEHGKHSLTQTFILFTPETYEQLDSKRKYFKPYPSAEFYIIEQKEFERELKVFEFLEKIGSQRVEYREIEELYVTPENYDKIKSTLDEHNIVFIIGDAEMGKTYTAIRLLWEYFKEGYKPVYIGGERKKEQWELIRHKTQFDEEAIYLEDPWGLIEFDRSESLFKDIGTFITEVKRNQCKIIVTSREKVFKEFEKRKETEEDLWKYVTPLKINLAYSKENLSDMLKKYITVFEPSWSNTENLTRVAFEAIEKKLRTPMSIKNFVVYSKDIKNTKDLEIGIEKVAKETKKTFASEIKEMFKNEEFDKVVFLSFPYIYLEPEIAKSCYEAILKDIECNLINARTYYELIEVFNNEVEVSGYALRYIHPSYWDAFASALMDNGEPNNISKKIFSRVLWKLSEKNEAAGTVVRAIVHNFDKLPEDVRNLLLELSEKNKAAYSVVFVLFESFNKISEDLRNELLLKLSEKDEVATTVAQIIAHNFDKLPDNVRNLLPKLSDKDEVAIGVAWGIAYNFDKISEDLRNKLLLKLSKKDKAVEVVAKTIAENFDKLPDKVRNLLFEFSEKDEFAEVVAKAIAENFDKLPEDVRNLLLKLCTKDKIVWDVAWTIAEDFSKTPEDVRNKFQLFCKLSERDEIAWYVTEAIAHNFDKISEEVRNELLMNLSEKEKASEVVVRVVSHNFDKISGDIRNKLLLTLSEKDNAARAVARIIAFNFDKISEDVRNELLLKLSKKKEAAGVVRRIITKKFKRLEGT